MLTRWSSRIPDLRSEMSRLNREMDRLFGESGRVTRAGVFPPLNLYDRGENLVIRAEVPGIEPEDLEINVTMNTVTIRGERKQTAVEENASFHRRERSHGTFGRSVSLPQEIDSDKVQASYKLGVLELILPKAEAAKPRKVEIVA